MDVELLSRIQFAITVAPYYLFPPLSIGLGPWLLTWRTCRPTKYAAEWNELGSSRADSDLSADATPSGSSAPQIPRWVKILRRAITVCRYPSCDASEVNFSGEACP